MQNKQELRVKKAHIALMKHPETAQYSGVLLMGVSEQHRKCISTKVLSTRFTLNIFEWFNCTT